MDLGRVWEGFWEGLGRDLGRFGWILRGLRAIWALWGLFARFCMYFQAFYAILHILDQSSQAKPCFTFSCLRLHAPTVIICFRSSCSLLRQIVLLGSSWHFLGIFPVFFLTSNFDRIFFDFGKFWKPKCVPKSVFGKVFCGTFWAPPFWSNCVTIFMLSFKSQPSKFVRPRHVLLILTVSGLIAKCVQSWSKNQWILKSKIEKK